VLSLTDPSHATFGVYDFNDGNIQGKMERLSFLSADNLPDERDLVCGVVHPGG
jgi:hypothetical protein